MFVVIISASKTSKPASLPTHLRNKAGTAYDVLEIFRRRHDVDSREKFPTSMDEEICDSL